MVQCFLVRRLLVVNIAFGLVAFVAQGQSHPDPVAAGQAGVNAAFEQQRVAWAHSLRDKNIDASVAAYAPDADFLQPDGSRVRGAAALRKLFESITATYNSDLTFQSLRVESSGSLAYDSGTYSETLIDRATAKPQISKGSYLTVYRRSASGQWLIIEQVWTGAIE
jgi:ketosteroid isomerase-like protein